MKRKLSGAIVAVLVIAWLGLFVSDKQVLVWEVSPDENFVRLVECEQATQERCRTLEESRDSAEPSKPISFDELWDQLECEKSSTGEKTFPACKNFKNWTCTYFNGRRLVEKNSSHIAFLRRDGKSYGGSPETGCPNFLDRGH